MVLLGAEFISKTRIAVSCIGKVIFVDFNGALLHIRYDAIIFKWIV